MSKKRLSSAEALTFFLDEYQSCEDGESLEEYERLADVIDEAVESDDIRDIVLLPPNKVDNVSDEEVIDEDDLLPSALPNEVPGTVAILKDAAAIENPLCHEVFFDNFFTSYDLLLALQKQNIKATETVHENRLKQCSLMETSQMKKKERGCFDAVCDGHVLAVKWHDNQCVIVASNYNNIEPLGKARRWSKARKCPVDLPQPAVIGLYNTHMGEVDILDRYMANYRPVFHSKKWWWPLFVNGINMAVVAAWRLHVEVGGTFDHLEFRRDIVRTLLQLSEHRTPSKSGPSSRPVSDVRFDGYNHHLTSSEKQGRCRMCKKNSRLVSTKCRVPLHLHCE
ncbi:piggyBac transposable element-derived protein 3-like [Rhinatrema bivittatum]|uniref:piggyBac transposable element-derived protein 3-like n=1 Tax=Rhinatrema bivittatum TaxID=194408 RepID=UPI0011273EC4|nr:piggyBac transposable element-derived protein 3-like [Rhinatrema bivittatum]XP_029454807.1 piggyBac transposable element-derived protein 3-like [Rhinatrema bivittatum]